VVTVVRPRTAGRAKGFEPEHEADEQARELFEKSSGVLRASSEPLLWRGGEDDGTLACMNIRQVSVSLFLLSAGLLYSQAAPPGSTVWAEGLLSPRGLVFGPDGFLYVAEAGAGGTQTTGKTCTQVPAPIGPYSGGNTARISAFNSSGTVTTVITGLPSAKAATGDLQGVSAVAFVGDNLYALVAGGGCSHGNTMPNGVYQINRTTHTAQLLADLSTFFMKNPVSHPNAADFEPDGVPYSMIEAGGDLYIVEPNHGRLLQVTTAGKIQQILDISAPLGHVVPTSVLWQYDQFWIGNLGLFPITPASENVYQVSPKGCIVDHISGLTAITGLATDGQGALYVVQLSTAAGLPQPGTGNLIRIVDDVAEVVLADLIVPTALTVGPDGAIYISDEGATPSGRILRFIPPPVGQGISRLPSDAHLQVSVGSCRFSPKLEKAGGN
jgi:hypothetical protein